MEAYTLRVIRLIQRIPEGKVSTYGRIALMAGNPHGARQVVRIRGSPACRKVPVPTSDIGSAAVQGAAC